MLWLAAAICFVLVASCGDDGAGDEATGSEQPGDDDAAVGDDDDNDDDNDDDTTPTECDFHGLTPGRDYEFTISWDGRDRTYSLHVPADYDCTPRPLIVGLHYYSGDGHSFETDVAKIHDFLNEHGVFGLFPDGLAETPTGFLTALNDITSHHDAGPDGPTCTWWSWPYPVFDTCPDEVDRECKWGTSCADDVGMVRALIERLEKNWMIDPDRIHLTGFSQGAIAAQGWACPLGDLLASVAPLHGFAANGWACGPSTGVSLMQVTGRLDIFINAFGHPSADGLIYDSEVETAAAWAEAQQCSADGSTPYPTVSDGIRGWGCSQHAGCATGADVVSCVWDGTHTWGRDPFNGDFFWAAVWEFFASHPRRGR
jgi:polyhydroxybutyrate depolymerase